MRLLFVVVADIIAAVLARGVLFKAGCSDIVHLGMLAPMGHHFVGVGAHEVTLNAVEVRRLIGHRSHGVGIWTVGPTAAHITSELVKVSAHKSIESFMTCYRMEYG